MSTDTSDEGYDESTPGQPSHALAPSVDVDPAPTVDPDGAAAESNHQVDGADADTATGRVPDPKVGMQFKSHREVKYYYKDYAHQTGFVSKSGGRERRRAQAAEPNTEDPDDQAYDYCRFFCNRMGVPASLPLNPKSIVRVEKTDCKAKINVKKGLDGVWRITTVTLDHKHDLISEGRQSMGNNRLINKKRLHGVPNKEKYGRNMSTWEKRLNMMEGDFTATVRYLEAKALECPDLFYVHRMNDEGVVADFLWVDGRCRAAFEDFGDVVSFGSIYTIDNFRMPLAPFIGVNHHGMSTILGCALITTENTETYTWVFEQWIRCMNGKTPSAIITIQDPAMG